VELAALEIRHQPLHHKVLMAALATPIEVVVVEVLRMLEQLVQQVVTVEMEQPQQLIQFPLFTQVAEVVVRIAQALLHRLVAEELAAVVLEVQMVLQQG
jgi:hypothetical protein